MNREYTLRLDLQFTYNNPAISFRQSDSDTADFFIQLTRGGEPVCIDNAIVVLVAIKPDGTVVSQFLDAEGNIMYANLESYMKDQIGIYQAQALLIYQEERVTTDVIEYEVLEDNIIYQLENAVSSTEDFTMLQEMLSRLSTIEQQENQREVNESERIQAEESRYEAEKERVKSEDIRNHEEADRAKYEATRQSNENERIFNEVDRVDAENSRLNNENIRVANEESRIKAEQERINNYNFMTEDEERRRSEANSYAEAELARVQAETDRVDAEAKRRTVENARVLAEQTRMQNENSRISQENSRVLAEQTRAKEHNTKIQSIDDALNDFEVTKTELETSANETIQEVANTIESLNNAINDVDAKMQEVDELEQQRENNESERILAENSRESERIEQNAKIEEGLKELHEHLEHYPACSGKKYGVRFYKSSSDPEGERLGDAVGLTANSGVGQEYAINDFDDIYPWGFRRVCTLNNEGKVTAYEGDPDFKRDGSNGHVMVETPLFYQKYVETDDYVEYWIADYYAPGFRLSPRFKQSDGTVLRKIYTGAYKASLVEDMLTSRSGIFPRVEAGRHTFRNWAKANGDGFGLTDIAYRCDILFYLFVIEFATLNSQSVMKGLTTFQWDYTTTEATNNSNTLTLDSNNIAVGFTLKVDNIDRRVVSVDSSNNTVTVDGEPFTIDSGVTVSSRAWICGETDNVKSSSGSMLSNTNGKNCCKYRGEENPWGNIWEWVDGCNIKDHQAYVHWNPTEYTDDEFDSPYTELSYINCTSDGYVKTMGHDENNPYACLPTQMGGASNTYFSDYYYQNAGNKAPLVGASLSHESFAGLVFWNCSLGFGLSLRSLGARLSYKPS